VTAYVVQARGEDAEALARASFVPDAFAWGAFVFGPFWLVYRGLWLALAGWIAFEAVDRILVAPHLSTGASLALDTLVAAYLGFEGNRWRQEKLARRAAITDVIEAPSRDVAETMFYTRHGEAAA
jgi:hypothetical protein